MPGSESRGAGRALDALNFCLADVRDGLGPYLAIYLLAVHHWDQASIGIALSASAIAGLLAQTPGGALVDAIRAKRGLIVAAALLVTATCLIVPVAPGFWPVVITQALAGAAHSVFAPAIAAITLGVAGRAAFTRRTGRNESFNHAGNAFAAAAAGGLSYLFGPIVVFWLLAGMAVLSVVSVLAIPADAIDHEVARGLEAGETRDSQASAWSVLLACRPLLVFAACVTLFHFANAAMLPLVGQKLAERDANQGTALMSVCIVAAQVVMVPMAMLVGARADAWGRKPLFLAGFLVLTARGFLYTLSDDPYWLVAVQSLDGVGAGLFGALFPIITADLTRGTGHFNISLGAIATAQGIGAGLSQAAGGYLVTLGGYSTAFLTLAAVGAAGTLLFWSMMPDEPRPMTQADLTRIAAILVFLATYSVVAVGRMPGLRLDRTGAAVLGGALMVACGALSERQAFEAIDLGTLTLLLGMMLLVANLRLAGFFRLVTVMAAARARHPATLLAAVVLVSGGLSAVLVNDTVCLAVTPLVVALARHLRRDPLPYLLAVAMAANIGSAATITGNPQNMIVGGFSHLSWGAFALALTPVAALGLVACFAIILLLHPGEFLVARLPAPEPTPLPRIHRALAVKSALVALGVVIAFLAGVPVALASLLGGSLLLLTRRVKPEKVWREVDWPLLAMFAGLFVVVDGLERMLLTPEVLAAAGRLHLENPLSLTVVTTLLSSLVSNVPAVLVLKPFIEPLADPQRAWLLVAMASTMAGNLTLVGSVANLIVAQRAAAEGVEIGFWRYARTGIPVTLATLAIGLWWR